MRLFLTKILTLSLILVAILFSINLLNKLIISYSSLFLVDNTTNKLILGDSHTKYALNDELMKKTINLSKNADSYFYSYLKLKALKKRNAQIDTLLLSFSSHNVERSIEKRWLLDNSHLRGRLLLYYPIMDIDDFCFILQKKPKEVLQNSFTQILFAKYYFTQGITAYGGYEDLKQNKLDEEIKKHEKEEDKIFQESEIEKHYLSKINKYCIEQNIKLILVNTPLHNTINKRQESLYKFYNSYFKDILFLDFSKIKMPDSCFGDLVHLSPEGSDCFSKHLNKVLKNKIPQKGYWSDSSEICK